MLTFPCPRDGLSNIGGTPFGDTVLGDTVLGGTVLGGTVLRDPGLRGPVLGGPAVLGEVFLALSLLAASPVSAALVVDSADDLCAPSVDPCVVAQAVDVVAGSHLDFGLRTLRIEGSGFFEFPDGNSSLTCGRLETATNSAAIRVRGGVSMVALPGTVTLRVMRRCSLAAQTPCLVDSQCEAVAGGVCSGGSGEAVLDAGILGSAENPGRIVVRAAGDLSLLAPAAVAGTRTTSDGGSLELESTGSSVLVAAAVDVSGGGGGSGGELWLIAAGDITVGDRIDANGGEYDAGSITLEAGGDVTIADDIRADALGGAGFGGAIDVTAAGDVTLAGGTASNNVVLSTEGHQSADNYGGDGGTQAFEADGNLAVSRYVRFSASAAPPDGFADSLSFAAGGDIDFGGSVVAKGRGIDGGGALVDLVAAGSIRASATASFDLTGPAAGGDLMIDSDGALDFAADVDVSGGPGGLGGRVVAVAAGDADISGEWTTAGADSAFSVGDLFVEGCRVRVSGTLANSAAAGRNRLVAHDSVSILTSGSMRASGDGTTNSIEYRSASRPPVVDGLVLPSASLEVDAALSDCPVCGNAEVNVGESCDDGNTAGGDGCSVRCQNESCEAATPGYPGTALCSDANECTADSCATDGACIHAPRDGDCDAADFCSVGGTCIEGACLPSSAPSLSVSSLKIRLGRDAGRERAAWKAEFPAHLLALAPSQVAVRVVIVDDLARPLADASLPAGSFQGEDGSWRFASPDGADASGIGKASIEAVRQGDVVRVRVKMRGDDLAAATLAEGLSLALLIGDAPLEALCSSSGRLLCTKGRGKVFCESAPR